MLLGRIWLPDETLRALPRAGEAGPGPGAGVEVGPGTGLAAEVGPGTGPAAEVGLGAEFGEGPAEGNL